MTDTDTDCIEEGQYPLYRDGRYRRRMHIDPKRAERLRQARQDAGFETATAAATAFGWGVGGYRHHENATRGFGADKARIYGRAFKVKAGWLLGIDGTKDNPVDYGHDLGELLVNGSVEAGAWRESTEWNDDRTFTITDLPSPVKGLKRFGLEVVGNSMDLFYEPGTVLDCASIFVTAVAPQTGDHVIAEQVSADGLRELTVKEYVYEDGHHFLVPRSSKREFQKRIEIGEPSTDHWGDDNVQVIGFVVAPYPPRILNLFARMNKIRR